jgi:hypothetical protein
VAPRDVPHTYCVESDEARFLALSMDTPLDRFFFAVRPASPRAR